MQITILQISKTKHDFVLQAEAEYLKRLQAWAKVNVVTLKESSTDSDSATARQKAKEQEGERLLASLPEKTFLVVLDETGKEFSSPDFAKFVQKNRDFEGANLTFLIGGPFGLSDAVRKRANLLLSFSKFTFTHEMIRMLLLEQIYRAFTIISNKTYHY